MVLPLRAVQQLGVFIKHVHVRRAATSFTEAPGRLAFLVRRRHDRARKKQGRDLAARVAGAPMDQLNRGLAITVGDRSQGLEP
jgi:hypothetical protein